MKIRISRSKVRGRVVTATFSDFKLVLREDAPSFILGFICQDRWYYQWLSWHSRGGKCHYYAGLVQFYRYLRRNGLTNRSLSRLATADRNRRDTILRAPAWRARQASAA